MKHQDSIETFLYLGKVFTRLDQPLAAVEVYNQALEKYTNEVSLITGIARIYEVMQINLLFFKKKYKNCKISFIAINLYLISQIKNIIIARS